MRDDVALEEAGELGVALYELRDVGAPASLLPHVLTQVGLADWYFPLDTPIGPVFVAYNGRGLSAVMRADSGAEFEQAFRAQFGRSAHPTVEPRSLRPAASEATLRKALVEQLQGTPAAGRRSAGGYPPDLRFDLRGLSEFEEAVLRKALEIPRGQIRPYAWIAREIGRPRAARAVGSALANNPVPLFIPCHRVVRSDGMIGNYGLGGPANKRAILEWEGVNPDEVEDLARAGIRYIGTDTTKIYCFPTCRHARRITTSHRRPFRSEREAAAAGFRPCSVCRPPGIAVGQ